MKRIFQNIGVLLLSVICYLLPANAFATNDVIKITHDGINEYAATSAIDSIYFSEDGNTMYVQPVGVTDPISFSRTDISCVSYIASAECPTSLTVTYNGNTATIDNPYFLGGVSISKNGAYVTVTNTDVANEYTTTLTGTTTDGNFIYKGDYKTTIVLSGVSITSTKGAAIDIECGKRIAMEIKKGTTNTLVDAAGGKQKAALYCTGHLEIDKTGTLNVTGNTGHAISAKEYIQLKKSTGTINVLGAVKDGIHCKQYFLANGFTVNINKVGDDGIQVEKDGEANDDGYADGSLNIQGGNFTIQVDSTGASAFKADSTVTIANGKSDPIFSITTTGNACKGINSNGSVNISAGTFTFTQTGSYTFDGTDMSYVTAIKADKDINITGGKITINNTADGGKGLSADGNVTISGDATVIDITASANGGSAKVNISGDNTEEEGTETTKSYRVYVTLPTSGSSSQLGPGGQPGQMGQSAYWTNVYLYNSTGTKVAQLTNKVTLTSGSTSKTFYYYDFGAATSGTYYFMSDNYTAQSRPGSTGTSYTIKSGTFTGPTSGQDYYYEIASSKSISGTTYTFAISNVTNTWNGAEASSDATGEAYKSFGIKADGDLTINSGSVTINNGTGIIARGISANNVVTNGGTLKITNGGTGFQGTNDSWTAKGIHADNSIALNAGTITISMTGNGGKGIDSDGTYTQGTSDGNGPTLTVTTTGSSFGASSSSGMGGQRGGQTATGSDAKAIKAEGYVIVYGGTTVVTTATNGAEGLESKTSISVMGGNHYFKCYDDCINSSGQITFKGGNTVCYSFGNDAVDSNYGRSGAITISGGNVFAYSTKGAPEEGFDCDNNSYITITGGIAVSAGGAQGGGSSSIGSSSQGYYIGSSPSSYGTSYYYTLCNTSGTPICTYKFEANCSNNLSLLTASDLGRGSVTVKYGTAAPTACTSQVNNAAGNGVFFIAPTVTTTGTTATVTSK